MNASRRQFLKQSLVLSSLSIVSPLPSRAAPAPAPAHNALGVFVYLDGREPDEALAPVKELGLTGCELYLNEFPDAYAVKLRATLDRLGLQATALFASGPGPQVYDFYQGPETIGLVPRPFSSRNCGKPRHFWSDCSTQHHDAWRSCKYRPPNRWQCSKPRKISAGQVS